MVVPVKMFFRGLTMSTMRGSRSLEGYGAVDAQRMRFECSQASLTIVALSHVGIANAGRLFLLLKVGFGSKLEVSHAQLLDVRYSVA